MLVLLALAAAALLTAASAAAAPAPGTRTASVAFDLPANNGLRAHLETFNGEVTLEVKRNGRLVAYEVEGEATEAGLKARFGTLGSIDVAFEPTEMHAERPPKGCKGPPSRWGEGFFTGTIQFTGEREYVRIDASRVKGTMDSYAESEWTCPKAGGLPRQSARPARETEVATLAAIAPRCRCYLLAFKDLRRKRVRSYIYAGKVEEGEGMKTTRATYVEAGAAAFVFDHAAGTAALRPPGPFSGHASFERRAGARDLWRSTIEVPLLGADPLRVHGSEYRARLIRALPGD